MMKRYRRTAISQYAIVAALIVLILGLGIFGLFISSRISFNDDFAIPWAASRAWLLNGVNPYESIVIETAIEAIETSPFQVQTLKLKDFSQPLFSLIFYLPLSLLPYPLARTIWFTLLGLSVGVIGVFSVKLSGLQMNGLAIFFVILILLTSLPSAIAIIGGNIFPIIVGLVLFSIYLIQNKQDTTAGFILAVACSNFLTIGLVISVIILWAIAKKRWSIATSFFSGVIFMIIISYLLLPSWFHDWASVLLRLNLSLEWIRTPLMDFSALLPGIEKPLSVFLHSIFGLLAIISIISLLWQPDHVFIYNIIFIFVISYFLNVRTSVEFLLLIVPALLFIMRFWSERWKRNGLLISWVVLVLTGIGPWLIVFPENDFTKIIDKPWIIIGYPLLVMVGLIWVRWWAFKIPKIPYEPF